MRGSPRLRRSLLFVPGGEERRFARALQSGADTIVFDLEDSVPPTDKGAARELVCKALGGGSGSAEAGVRVNGVDTEWFLRDLLAVVPAGAEAILLPKADSPETVALADRVLGLVERDAGREPGAVRLLAILESASGVARAVDLATSSPRLEALCFGHADFSLDMGLPGADPRNELIHHARCGVALAARASGLAAIDQVFVDVRDPDGFRADAERGISLGFEGKLCIHPAQVTVANELHTPGPEAIERARRAVAAWETAQAEGRGVATLDGKMIDAPLVELERRVLARARAAGVPTAAPGDS